MKTVIFLASLVLLSGCGGGPERDSNPATAYDPLLPLPGNVPEPDEPQMRAAVQRWLAQENAPSSSVYKFVREDLNGDGHKDALVLCDNPYGYWCDFNGCVMLILKAGGDDFSVVNKVKTLGGPLYITEKNKSRLEDPDCTCIGTLERNEKCHDGI
ncbi:MAG: hypothetical protein ACT4OY_03345 [Alphaproteobacteria bacterium]